MSIVHYEIDNPNNSQKNDEKLNQETCINCYSYGTKIYDDKCNEIICVACGCVDLDSENSNAINEMMKSLYKNSHQSVEDINETSGSGSSVITSYEKSMDFSKSGIISGHMSNNDSNNKKIKSHYTRLVYTEKNTLRNISTNREVNIMEGITTILKIIEKLKIPKYIAERAANIFRMFYPKDKAKKIKYINITNLISNKKKHGSDKNVSAKFVAITCVYFSLRENQDITSLIEFVNIIMKNDCIDSKLYTKDVVKKIINKIYNTIVNDFGLKTSYPDCRNTINQICNSYTIDENIKRDSIKLYELLSSNVASFQGTAPRTIAIVLIYICYIKSKKVPLFIKKTDLSIITLKKLYNKYLENLYTIAEINENQYNELKEGLDNGYKNKILLTKENY